MLKIETRQPLQKRGGFTGEMGFILEFNFVFSILLLECLDIYFHRNETIFSILDCIQSDLNTSIISILYNIKKLEVHPLFMRNIVLFDSQS